MGRYYGQVNEASSSSSFFSSSIMRRTFSSYSMGRNSSKEQAKHNQKAWRKTMHAALSFPSSLFRQSSIPSSGPARTDSMDNLSIPVPKTPRNVAATCSWSRFPQVYANTHSLPLLMYLSSMMPMSTKTNLHTMKPKNSAACRALSSSPTWVGEECFSPGSSA